GFFGVNACAASGEGHVVTLNKTEDAMLLVWTPDVFFKTAHYQNVINRDIIVISSQPSRLHFPQKSAVYQTLSAAGRRFKRILVISCYCSVIFLKGCFCGVWLRFVSTSGLKSSCAADIFPTSGQASAMCGRLNSDFTLDSRHNRQHGIEASIRAIRRSSNAFPSHPSNGSVVAGESAADLGCFWHRCRPPRAENPAHSLGCRSGPSRRRRGGG